MTTAVRRKLALVPPPIRIVVADDHPVVRFGVKNMLLQEPGFQVIGEAEDGDIAITQTLESEPDLLLLDLQMPRLPGLEALKSIMGKSPRVKIILLTSTVSTQQVIEALQLGARGIILKDAVASDLADALRAVVLSRSRIVQRPDDTCSTDAEIESPGLIARVGNSTSGASSARACRRSRSRSDEA